MALEQGLFRQEVIEARRGQWLGAINLATPLAFRWWMLLALVLASAIALFLAFGHYTRRETVTGQLEPRAGIITLNSNLAGTVTRTFVHEGEHVSAGQALVDISANLDSTSMGNTHAVVSAQLRREENQARATLAGLRPNAALQDADLRRRIVMLKRQISQTNARIALQRREIKAATQLVRNAMPLRRRGIISTVQFDQFQATALTQQANVKQLLQQRLGTEQQLSSLHTQLAQLPIDTRAKANQLRSQLAQLDTQLAENEAARSTVLRAPRAGVVSTLLARAGQNVAAGEPLLSILPKGSRLQAQLLVPSTAIGFVSPGDMVVLRYQAFPYQKFGQQYGKVAQVSRSALAPREVASLLGHAATKPVYRVLVTLNRQSIDAFGKAYALKPGMALSADILLDRRNLWQWVFEPLYGLRQQLATNAKEAAQG